MYSTRHTRAGWDYPDSSLRFDRITVDDGLPSNWVYSVIQDRYGFMWIATRGGLSRYDGYEHQVYLNEPTDPQSISDNDIKGLYEDSRGTLWVCTNSGELNRYNRATDTFTRFSLNPKDATIECLFAEESGVLWIHTPYDNGFFVNRIHAFDLATETFTYIDIDEEEEWERGKLTITSIVAPRLSPGKLWYSTSSKGVYEFDVASQTSKPLFQGPQFVNALVESEVTPGILWLATEAGLGRLDTSTLEYIEYNLPRINQITEDEKGNLWLSRAALSRNELYFFERETNLMYRVVMDVVGASNARGIPLPEGVFNPYVDREGLLWMGSFGGIYRLNWRTAGIQTNRQLSSLSFDNIFDAERTFRIYEDSSGAIWAGSPGLYRFNVENEGSLFPSIRTANFSIHLPISREKKEGYFYLLCLDGTRSRARATLDM